MGYTYRNTRPANGKAAGGGCIMRCFEYKSEVDVRDGGAGSDGPESVLNRFGAQGWELVSVVPMPTREAEDATVRYFFKRELKMEAARSSYAYGA
jgi:hypothetical protein